LSLTKILAEKTVFVQALNNDGFVKIGMMDLLIGILTLKLVSDQIYRLSGIILIILGTAVLSLVL
jgi:hypothetical protein